MLLVSPSGCSTLQVKWRELAQKSPECCGKLHRNELEKAREKLLVSRYNLGEAKLDVTTATASYLRLAEAIEARTKTVAEAVTARNLKLASSKEVADYKTASERLLGLLKERDKALREASDAGKDIRTELEKAADKLNTALANSPEYHAAVKRLKAARQNNVVTDLELTESPSVPLRAALLRVELAGKK